MIIHECIKNLAKLCPFILKILSKYQILTLLFCKFASRDAICNPNVDLVNDNVYTKFAYILSCHSLDIGQKLNFDVNQG